MNRLLLIAFALIALVCGFSPGTARAVENPRPLNAQTARTFPYNLVGQLFFDSGGDSYIGSGTVIRPSSILTAGHNLFDPKTGWSTDLLFRRAAYGETVATEKRAARLYLMSGYRTYSQRYGSTDLRTFSADVGGILFKEPLAAGGFAGWSTDRTLLTGPAYKIGVGYGAEDPHTGEFPLFISPAQGFTQTLGAFYETRGSRVEGGMSGGPLFSRAENGQLYLTGVIVAGSERPYVSGGIRVLNPAIANFIKKYLK